LSPDRKKDKQKPPVIIAQNSSNQKQGERNDSSNVQNLMGFHKYNQIGKQNIEKKIELREKKQNEADKKVEKIDL